MHPILEIFSQGEEIVTGQVLDSNAAWLSQQAVQLGFEVSRHSAVGDKLTDLTSLLGEIAGRADCCICTGGLGPTSDDLTAEAVAAAFGIPLEFDAEAYQQIGQFFKNRNRTMPESNRKQAMLPKGSLRLDNHWGTAPGFALQYQRCWFAFMPGVPSEMRQMYLEKVLPILHQRFCLNPKTLVTIKTIGIGESDLQQRLNAITIPKEVGLGFRASDGEVQVKLLFPHAYPTPALQELTQSVSRQIGNHVYAIDSPNSPGADLVTTINDLMLAQQQTLAIIETASQGLISSLCIGSYWLHEAQFQNNTEKLAELLAVSINTDDWLNTALALAMAKAKQNNTNTNLILVQLYSGGQNGLLDPNKTITIYTVLLATGTYHHSTHILAGPCKRKQHQSALLALDLLRRYLQNKLT